MYFIVDEFKRLVQDVNQKRLQRLDKTDEIGNQPFYNNHTLIMMIFVV